MCLVNWLYVCGSALIILSGAQPSLHIFSSLIIGFILPSTVSITGFTSLLLLMFPGRFIRIKQGQRVYCRGLISAPRFSSFKYWLKSAHDGSRPELIHIRGVRCDKLLA